MTKPRRFIGYRPCRQPSYPSWMGRSFRSLRAWRLLRYIQATHRSRALRHRRRSDHSNNSCRKGRSGSTHGFRRLLCRLCACRKDLLRRKDAPWRRRSRYTPHCRLPVRYRRGREGSLWKENCLDCYTISRVDKHPKMWYNKKKERGKRNVDLQ